MQTAEKISITMTPEMMRVVRASVEAGEYASASEVFRDAVRVWQREREERAERLEAIRAQIKQSMDDPRPDFTMDEMREWLATLSDEDEESDRGEALQGSVSTGSQS